MDLAATHAIFAREVEQVIDVQRKAAGRARDRRTRRSARRHDSFVINCQQSIAAAAHLVISICPSPCSDMGHDALV